MQIQIQDQYRFEISKAEREFIVPVEDYSAEVLAHIFQVGLGRIMNDLVAGTAKGSESEAAVYKKLDSWAAGVIRTSGGREGNPVKARAVELAMKAVNKNPTFLAWCAELGVKVTHKDAVAEARRQAKVACDKPGNPFMAKAAKDIAEEAEMAVEVEL